MSSATASSPLSDHTGLSGAKLLAACLAVGMGNFLVVLDTTIANVSVPTIAGGLGVSPTQGTWVITAYAVAEAITVPLTGFLSKRFGAIRLFVACYLAFAAVSLLCGLASSMGALIAGRVLLGLVGGPIMPLSQLLLLRIAPKKMATQVTVLWAMTTLVAPVVGPILGGIICDDYGWSWIFYIKVPIALAGGLATLLLLRGRPELSASAYIIESGSVEAFVERGGHEVQLGIRGSGSLVGETLLINDQPFSANIRALEDCEALEITREDFSSRFKNIDPIFKMVMGVIASRSRDLIDRTESFKGLGPEAHAASVLAENNNQIHDLAMSKIKMQNELKSAMEKKELTLFYQPTIDVQNMKIVGFEALMRWNHPEKGIISPGVFIPVAEESGLIVEMSRFALDLCCENVGKLQGAVNPATSGPNPLFVGVNFSVTDFEESDFFAHIQQSLKNSGVRPEQIHLEITEGLLIKAPEAAKSVLERCRDIGIDVSIDDFGTGYSSLSYLHYFPIDTLKIDQSFIRAMTTDNTSLILVKSIISLARNLNMKIIAEGVETKDEARIIRDLGVDYVQGFWFSKPLPFDDALGFLRDWQPAQF